MKEGSSLYSVFYNKCPRCHKGDFWPSANPYKNLLQYKGSIYEYCNHCGLKYEKETGFWYGAMYVSYAIGVATFVSVWVATEILWGGKMSMWWQIGLIVASLLLMAPVTFHYSRLVWINFFVQYRPDKNYEKPEKPSPLTNR